MLVAVVTKTLALNKGEKHVHFFMLDIQISKRVRENLLFGNISHVTAEIMETANKNALIILNLALVQFCSF